MRRFTMVLMLVALTGAAYAVDQADIQKAQDEFTQPADARSADGAADDTQLKTDASNQPATTFIPSKKSEVKKFYGSKGIVMPLDWQPDGYIVTDSDKMVMISAGDTVYVNMGREKVKPGTRCEIYRILKKLKDPKDRKYIGVEVLKMGFLEITADVGDKASSAKIIASNDPLKPGDAVMIMESESK